MTSTPARGAESVRGAPVRSPRASFVTPALIILLVAGLALRFAIAFLFFPESGFSSDLSSYAAWANTLAHYGPGWLLRERRLCRLPAWLPAAALADRPDRAGRGWPRGSASRGPDQDPADPDRRRGRARALPAGQGLGGARAAGAGPNEPRSAAAAIYLFNPVTWYDSALWGQTDAAGALVILLGVAALIRGNTEGAAALAVDRGHGQAAVRRRAHPAGRRRPPEAPPVRPGLGPDPPPARSAAASASGCVANQGPSASAPRSSSRGSSFFAMALPFGMGPYEYLTFVFRRVGGYPYLTVNGYNLWALIGADGSGSLASDRALVTGHGPAPRTHSGVADRRRAPGRRLPAVAAGRLPARQPAHDPGRRGRAVGGLLRPADARPRALPLPGLRASCRSWRSGAAAGAGRPLAFAVGSFINLHAILTNANPQYGTDNVANLPFGDLFRTFPFVGGLPSSSRRARSSSPSGSCEPARRSTSSSRHDDRRQRHDGLAEPTPSRSRHRSGDRGQRPHRAPSVSMAGARRRTPRHCRSRGRFALRRRDRRPVPKRPSWPLPRTQLRSETTTTLAGPGARSGVRGSTGSSEPLRPVRRDRSAELLSEPTGRLRSRSTLLILIVLTVGSAAAARVAPRRSRATCTSTRSTTPGRPPSSCRTGATASSTRSTSTRTRTSPSTRWRSASRPSGTTRSISTAQLPQSVVGRRARASLEPCHTAPAERNGDRMYVWMARTFGVYDLATRSSGHDDPARQAGHRGDGRRDGAPALYVAVGRRHDQPARHDRTRRAAQPIQRRRSIPPTPESFDAQRDHRRHSSSSRWSMTSWSRARTTAGSRRSIRPTPRRRARLHVPGAVKAVRVPSTDQVVVDQTKVTNLERGDEADRDRRSPGTPAKIRPLLSRHEHRVAISRLPVRDGSQDQVQKQTSTRASCPASRSRSGPVVAVSDTQGVTFLDAVSLRSSCADITLPGAPGMALVDHGFDNPDRSTWRPIGPAVPSSSLIQHATTPVPMLDQSALTMPGLVQRRRLERAGEPRPRRRRDGRRRPDDLRGRAARATPSTPTRSSPFDAADTARRHAARSARVRPDATCWRWRPTGRLHGRRHRADRVRLALPRRDHGHGHARLHLPAGAIPVPPPQRGAVRARRWGWSAACSSRTPGSP